MRKFTRKTVAVAAGTLLLLGGGAAFAYWTTTGSGTGTAATGTNVPVTINQTTVITGMYPGQTAITLAGTFNNTNPGNAYVTAVTAPSYTIDAGHASCAAAGNYVLGGTAVITGNDVAPGSPAVGSSWTGLTIQMVNLGTNQDACKGATVTINYASS